LLARAEMSSSTEENSVPTSSTAVDCVSVWVLGASGDLAHKKTYPSLYELFRADLLPKRVVIIGYARSAQEDDAFRATIRGFIKSEGTDEQREAFLRLCVYRQGKYDDAEAFRKVSTCRVAGGRAGGGPHVARARLERGGQQNSSGTVPVPPDLSHASPPTPPHPLPPISSPSPSQVAAEASVLEDALVADLPSSPSPPPKNRLFYFAIPPSVFVASAASVHGGALTTRGWNRVVVEKPFGKDSASSAALHASLSKYFTEEQIYRIDHYLGKEMVQNLMVLRFANAVFEPLWDSRSISNVQITFKEPFGTEGRGGYFDEFGIIRDVMQNHLLQVLSLVAMETPVSLRAEDVRDEKVKVLKCVSPVELDDVVLGQYGPNAAGTKPGYLDDQTVPRGSSTPTFATAALHINNARWRGVPFILKCGKALNERKAEIRIQFRQPGNGLFGAGAQVPGRLGVGQASPAHAHLFAHNNELVIRIQPNEAVYLKLMSKMPGLEFAPVETDLSLSYKARYPARPPPEAYARLLLDVFRGDQSQFVRGDELSAAWAIFTPLLHRIETERIPPIPYPYGSRGPPQSDKLIKACGYAYEGRYAGEWRKGHEPDTGGAVVKAIRDEFTLSADRLRTILDNFLGEMVRGLAGESSTIKMIPSFVTGLPQGTETGSVWAIDMGGSNLRVVEVVLKGAGSMSIGRELKVPIPAATMAAPAEGLFDFVADACLRAGMRDGDVVGFTFSFPVNQTGIAEGTLMEWTKGFTNPGVVGNDVVSLLEAAYRRKSLQARVVALVNDTVGTLMAAAYSDTRTRVGVILGTGTNAAYVERTAKIGKWHGATRDGVMLINMEWGGFGSSGSHAFFMLPFHGADHALDAHSPNEGKQRYEKMIAGMYLGEITRHLLQQLVTAGALLVGPSGEAALAASPRTSSLARPWGFTTANMSDVASDASADLSGVGEVLSACGAGSSTLADRTLVKEMCALVARRAARLAAVGIAAVITQMGDDGAGCAAATDGSVYKMYPNFKEVSLFVVGGGGPSLRRPQTGAPPSHALVVPSSSQPSQWMEEALKELGVNVALTFAEDGSGKGAALTAVVAAGVRS
jgi:glucose-6-phosphate 1-dehydrogenase